MTMYMVVVALQYFFTLIRWALVAYIIMSWIAPRSRVYFWLVRFVAPFINPFRRLTVKIMSQSGWRVDIAPWLAMVALSILSQIVVSIYYYALLPNGLI